MLPRLVSEVDTLAQLAALRTGDRRLRPGGGAGQRRRPQPAVSHPFTRSRIHYRCRRPAVAGDAATRDRTIEAIVLLLVATIGVCYFIEIFILPQTTPNFLEMGHALITPGFRQGGNGLCRHRHHRSDGDAAQPVFALGLGTKSQDSEGRAASIRTAIRFNTIDSTAALAIAFFVNAAILVLAAMVFYQGKRDPCRWRGRRVWQGRRLDSHRVPDAGAAPGHSRSQPSIRRRSLASGQSSTITGTLAGQVVMEGFMHWKLAPWVRRLITRGLAILPAIVIIGIRGDSSVNDLLTLSQVVLALQLPFAMFPLLHFTSSSKRMGQWKSGWFLLTTGWSSAILITAMDLYGLPDSARSAWQVIIGR